jgi:O-antigen biosynthesis protein
VEVTGYVPETAPYLRAAWVSIAPLRFGAGMKGKVGEAMSFGLPVVTTSVGAEGFGLTPGEHALVADDPDEFAQAVIPVS